MRYSKLALLSTLSAFALLTATSSPAFAPSVTDMGLLRPHKTWQVVNINAKNSNYCAMVSQFDKEISLAFARNPAGYGSLAIDFPGNILDTGMTYPITMQVDDLEARRYNVRAGSPRSLIVQIGQDEDFYSSLGSNGTLRISLPTVDMRFDLSKFSGSYISLIGCASKLPQHEGPRTAAMPVAPVEQSSLPGNATKTAAIQTPTVQTPKAQPPVPATPAAPITLATHPLNNSAPPVAVAQQKAIPVTVPVPVPTPASAPASGIIWTSAATSLTKDAALLATNAASKPKNAEDRLEDENESVVAENMELKSKLSLIGIEDTELKNNVNLLKSEKQDLQSKLDMKEKQSQMLETALNTKDTDLSSIRSLSNDDSKSLASAQAELAGLKRDHDAEIADLQMKLSEKTAQYDNLQKQFIDGAQMRKTAQETSVESQAELETLRQRLAQAQEQIASSDQQKSDLATQAEFQGQQNRTLLQRIQDQLSKATEQISLLESQLTAVAMQRDDLNAQLDATVNKNKALEAELQVEQREVAYRAPAAAPEPAPAPERDSMNLLGSERGYAPAVTQEDLSPPAAVKGSSSGSSKDSWDTVVVQ